MVDPVSVPPPYSGPVTLRELTPSWWRTIVVVAVCAAFAFLLTMFSWGLGTSGFLPVDSGVFPFLFAVDLAMGVFSLFLVAVFHRRRTFLPAAVAAALLGASLTSFPAGMYCLVSGVARVSRPRIVVLAVLPVAVQVAVGVAGGAISGEMYGMQLALESSALIVGIGVALGLGSRARMANLYALSREAEVIQREQQLVIQARDAEVERVRTAERTRLAREVHDALSHELSVIAMHAGALEFREDLTGEQQHESAKTIAASARRAGSELRHVITTLRDDEARVSPDDLRHLSALAERVTAAGSPTTLRVLPGLMINDVTLSVSQQLFRVIRELLHNAVRHAPGQPVTVTLEGNPDQGLLVECWNSVQPSAEGPDSSGSGVGQVGMAEVARLLGGRFEAGFEANEYKVRMWVPWPG